MRISYGMWKSYDSINHAAILHLGVSSSLQHHQLHRSHGITFEASLTQRLINQPRVRSAELVLLSAQPRCLRALHSRLSYVNHASTTGVRWSLDPHRRGGNSSLAAGEQGRRLVAGEFAGAWIRVAGAWIRVVGGR